MAGQSNSGGLSVGQQTVRPDELSATVAHYIGEFAVDDDGDICARMSVFCPEDLGWTNSETRAPRWTVRQLRAHPAFTVDWTPGVGVDADVVPRRPGHLDPPERFGDPGPPVLAEFTATGRYVPFDRVTEAFGWVKRHLRSNPQDSPVLVLNRVTDEEFAVGYNPTGVAPGGRGAIYISDDGTALKIGHSERDARQRIRELQTGNPREVRLVASIDACSRKVENYLKHEHDQWRVTGEWFARTPIIAAARSAGSWHRYLEGVLPLGTWPITDHVSPSDLATDGCSDR